jgi:hypothetical protein
MDDIKYDYRRNSSLRRLNRFDDSRPDFFSASFSRSAKMEEIKHISPRILSWGWCCFYSEKTGDCNKGGGEASGKKKPCQPKKKMPGFKHKRAFM